jgi:hypothetical protein
MQAVRPSLDLVKEFYASILPDFDFIVKKFESNQKWIKLSPRLHELTKNCKCENYPELYQDEARIQTAMLRALFGGDEQISEYFKNLASMSAAEQTLAMNEFFQDGMEMNNYLDENLVHLDDLDWSPEGQAEAKKKWDKLSQEEQQQKSKLIQYSLCFSLASFYNFFALMVHGRKLTQLVGEAMAGNDNSFCLAVHIDKNILNRIPYFNERHQRAINEGDQEFLEKVGRWLAAPQLNGKIRHRLLYMLFALLEGTGWLNDLKHREILDLCDELGLDRYENRIETENALTKRLIEYRKFQKSS